MVTQNIPGQNTFTTVRNCIHTITVKQSLACSTAHKTDYAFKETNFHKTSFVKRQKNLKELANIKPTAG